MDSRNNTVIKWIDEYADELFAWAGYKVSDPETARDLVQETFLAAVKGFDNFRGDSNPKTWLFSILNNKIRDHYREKFKKSGAVTNGREPSGTGAADDYFGEDGRWKPEHRPNRWTNTGNLLDDLEFREILKQCIDNLPERWSAAVNLKYLEEKEGTDICQELEISPTNFWQIIRRAKLQLRQCLEKNWFYI